MSERRSFSSEKKTTVRITQVKGGFAWIPRLAGSNPTRCKVRQTLPPRYEEETDE